MMTEQEAFEDWWCGSFMTQQMRSPDEWAHKAWHAALEWARTQQEPVAEVVADIQGKRQVIFSSYGALYASVPGMKLYAAPVAPTVPKGWKLVPEEPTRKMLSEIGFQRGHTREHRQLYRALLIAAPEYKDGE